MWIRDETRILHEDIVNVKTTTHVWIRDKTRILHQCKTHLCIIDQTHIQEAIVNAKSTRVDQIQDSEFT